MVRFNSPLLLAKHALKHLNPGPASSLTLTTGAVSRKPSKDWAVVASYATGLHGMMRSLAVELAPVRVNLISPGAVLTPLWDHHVSKEQLEGFLNRIKKRCTTGEVGRPEDMAESYLYVMRDVRQFLIFFFLFLLLLLLLLLLLFSPFYPLLSSWINSTIC